MKNISELKGILEQQLGWYKVRIDLFARALVGLLFAFLGITGFIPA